MKLLAIMLAGALGTAARYGVNVAVAAWLASSVSTDNAVRPFPLATLCVNVTGTLLLAIVTTLFLQKAVSAEWRLIVGTGFLGAFTTFSTFALESEELLAHADWKNAALYIGGNLIGGIIAIVAGRWLALRLLNAW